MDEFCGTVGEVVRSEMGDTISVQDLRVMAELVTGRKALVIPTIPDLLPVSARLNCRCWIETEFKESLGGGSAGLLRELAATLADAWREGDWIGHLRAWWAVATGGVTPQTRAGWPVGFGTQWAMTADEECADCHR